MKRRIAALLILILTILLLGSMVYWLQDRQISRIQYARPLRDQLSLPEPATAKILALGYDNLVASVLWLRVIQVFGAKLHHIRENPRELAAIENLFNVVTELDPRFIEAYKFGNFILGDEGDDQEAALRLLDRGIVKNYRRTYIIPYEAVFVTLMSLKDYDRARFYVNLAMKAPDCPEYVGRMLYYIEAEKGNYEIALERWIREDIENFVENDRNMITVARNQVGNIVTQWHTSLIEQAMDRYFAIHQDYPARVEQLEAENLFGSVRQVDGMRLVQLLDMARTLCAEGKVTVEQAVARLLETVDKGGAILESPRAPRNLDNEMYLLRHPLPPPQQGKPEIVEPRNGRVYTESDLFAIRRRIEEFHTQHERYPASLRELPGMQPAAAEKLATADAVGYPWLYDPRTGKIWSYNFPEL